MKHGVFAHKTVDFDKLESFGFVRSGQSYFYNADISDGQFCLTVCVNSGGEVKTKVVDTATDEEYTLHLVNEASGSFVGAVRSQYERVLEDIAEKCFYKDVFKSDCAHKAIEYVRKRYGDELEYLWNTFPSNAVIRRKDNRKWYAVFLTLSKRKLGFDSDEEVSIIDLRALPNELAEKVDGEKYFPGYHMNKKYWFTVCLDGSVSAEDICVLIDKSYELAKK